MATKKAAPKKAAVKAVTPAKKAATQPAKAASKSVVAQPAAVKKAEAVKVAPKKAADTKVAAPVAKESAPAPAKKVAAKAAPATKAMAEKPAVAAKTAAKTAAPKPVEPEVVKTAVAAESTEAVKPAIKPLAKPAAKKESSKPFVAPKTTTTRSVKYEPEFTKSVLDTSTPQEPTGPSMRYSDAELQEFRDLINRKLDTAKKELAYLQGLITRKDESGDLDEGRYMTMEDGSMSMEREQLSQMASRQIQFIDHLEKAIMRIENKTYGVCRVTGKLIEKARLRAVPHATLSIEAKQMMNK